MAKKTFRRSVASILAVLAVTGNTIAPVGTGFLFSETAIVAEAIDDSDFSAQKYAFDAESGTLFINGVIQTTQSNFFDDTTQNIDLGYMTTGIRNLNKDNIKSVVIMFQAVLPADSNRLFKDFKNLETVVVETGAKFDGSDSSIAHLSSTFEGCEKLAVADLSGLTNGNRVAYIDGLFKDCPNLIYADLSSITGEMMGTGTATQTGFGRWADWTMWSAGGGVDPVNDPTNGDESLAVLKMADSFVYNTINNLKGCYAADSGRVPDTADELLEDLLDGLPEDTKAALKDQLLEQYNRYEADQNYEAPVYTWSDGHMRCTATRQPKGDGDPITETVDAEVTVTTPATCTEAGSKTYRAVFTNTTHFNSVTYTEAIPATGHSFDTFVGFEWSEDFTSAQAKFVCSNDNCDEFELYDAAVTSQTTNPTCTEDGKIVYTAVYGDYSEDKEVTLDATDHNFDTFAGFVWSEDFTSAQAKFTCSHENCDEFELYDAEVTSQTTKPTCTEDGKIVYTAVYGDYSEDQEVTLDATDHSFDTFAGFVWSEDYTSAQAKFTCSHENCDQYELYEAEVTSETMLEPTANAPGLKTYTATYIYQDADGDFQTFSRSETVEIPPVQLTATVVDYKVAFGSEIGLIYRFQLNDDILADKDAYVTFEKNGVTTKMLISEAEKEVDSNYGEVYKFRINSVAKEYADAVTLKMFDGSDNVVAITGTTGNDYTNGITVSIQQYAQLKRTQGSSEQMRQVADALDLYCKAAQIYFEYNAEDLSMGDALADIDPAALKEYAPSVDGANPTGILQAEITTVFEEANNLKVKFTLNDDGNPDDYSFTLDDADTKAVMEKIKLQGTEKDTMVLAVTKILPTDFDKAHTFSITDGETTKTISNASVLTYAYMIYNKENQTQAAKDLALATYYYYTAAKAYDQFVNG